MITHKLNREKKCIMIHDKRTYSQSSAIQLKFNQLSRTFTTM